MAGLLQPWWLVALAAIPWIRWWHRRQAPLSVHTVSAVFLWQTSAASEAGAERRPPDPAWRRRALIAALLALALAGPYRDHEHAALTVWLDDSLSMQTLEDGRTRSSRADEQLAEALAEAGYSDVSRRSLSQPLAGDLEPGRAHWLITDGADERVRGWAAALPFERIITIGAETENVALTRLAARRNLDDPSLADLLVAISNTGTAPATRRLQLSQGNTVIRETTISLAPGETQSWQTRVAAESTSASLDGGDALRADDELTLAPNALRKRSVHVVPGCGPALQDAATAHPGLDTVPAADGAALVISCRPDAGPPTSVPHIHVVSGDAEPVASPPVWLPSRGVPQPPRLRSEQLAASSWPAGADLGSGQVLLQAGDKPLVILMDSNAGPAMVATVLDLRREAFARSPEFAALVAALVDAAFGEPLLDAVEANTRGLRESVIRPAAVESSGEAASRGPQMARQDLAPWLIAAAILVLMLDLVLLGIARRRARHA